MKKIFTYSFLFMLTLSLITQTVAQQRGITVKQGLGFTAVKSGSSTIVFDVGGLLQISSPFNYDTENTVSFLSESALGFRFNRIFSVDFAFLYFCPKFEGIGTVDSIHSFVQTTSYVFLFNGYINLLALFHHYFRFFDPYVGFGIGVSRNKSDETNAFQNGVQTSTFLGTTQSDFAYRFIVGLNFHIIQQLLAFIQYSYLDAGSFTTGSTGTNFTPSAPITVITKPKVNNDNNQLVFGLLYLFRT